MKTLSATKNMLKKSCLGCFLQSTMALALGAVLFALILAVFAPWGFFLGGKFHLMPGWQGIGRLHASSGDFVLYLWISPASSGRTYNFPYFNGWGYLCTPRGEKFKLRVTGGMHERTGIDSNGKAMHLSLHQRPWYYGFAGTYESRPRLELRGRWQNPDLVMDDGGTLSQAFLPDGSLYKGPPRNQPAVREKLQIVFHETGWLGFGGGCQAEAN